MILLLLNILIQYIIHFIQILSPEQMRVRWIRHNSVGKQKLLTKKYLAGNFKQYYLLDSADIFHYHENTKHFNNEIKQNKRNQTCHICHVNAWKAAYLMSHLVSYFKVGLPRLRKFLSNQNFPQPCSKKYHHLFVWSLKLKINEF